MGRKVHPIGMRLGINQPWQGRWFAEGKTYREQLHQDFAIRYLLQGGTSKGGAAANTRVRELPVILAHVNYCENAEIAQLANTSAKTCSSGGASRGQRLGPPTICTFGSLKCDTAR